MTIARRAALAAALLTIICAVGCSFQTSRRQGPLLHLVDERTPLDRALDEIGLTRETLRFDPEWFQILGGDRYLSPLMRRYRAYPLEAPAFAALDEASLTNAENGIHSRLARLLPALDVRLVRGLVGPDPLESAEEAVRGNTVPLASALRLVLEKFEQPTDEAVLQKLVEETRVFPKAAQQGAAMLIIASLRAWDAHRDAFARTREFATAQWRGEVLDAARNQWQQLPPRFEEVWERTDFPLLASAGLDVALALDRALPLLEEGRTSQTLQFEFETPLGLLVIRSGNEEYTTETLETPPMSDAATTPAAPRAVWLLIDLDGGDDLYRAPATVSPAPLSILVDVGGNDRYENFAGDASGFGAGLFGYGFLADLAGDDFYTGEDFCQGAAVLGIGVCYDRQGDDTYFAARHAQGAASFGVGLLVDETGNDTFTSIIMSQGFGFTRGAGCLLDLGDDDDRYLLRNDTLVSPSAQAPTTHNSNVGQGCGVGRRADLTDGHSWAGGVGLLIDGGGDDMYDGGVFVQGAGYWYGLGLLIDDSGNDTYTAYHYGQGASAHYAMGMLFDRGGNDTYTAQSAVAQGGAHDWSIAWFVDEAGDDVYETGPLSLGAGNMNGIGLFLDRLGDDSYTITTGMQPPSGGGARLSQRGSIREGIINVGVFLDTAGDDTYTGFRGHNNTLWRNPEDPVLPTTPGELGVGIDTESPDPPAVRLGAYLGEVMGDGVSP